MTYLVAGAGSARPGYPRPERDATAGKSSTYGVSPTILAWLNGSRDRARQSAPLLDSADRLRRGVSPELRPLRRDRRIGQRRHGSRADPAEQVGDVLRTRTSRGLMPCPRTPYDSSNYGFGADSLTG